MTSRLLLLLCAFAAACSLAAQSVPPEGCATRGRSPWLDKYQAGLIPPIAKSFETRYVPLRLTIVGDDNGGGYADPLSVLQSFQTLNEDFAKLNIQFYFDAPVAYLNSTEYTDHDFSVGRDLMNAYNVPNVVNNYIVSNPAGACGYYMGSSDAVALGVNCVNPGDRTWSHELGHFFGLPHTFFGWESVGDISEVEAFDAPAPDTLEYFGLEVLVERVDGSNCATAADGFCDTPPDYLPQRWGCNGAGYYPDSLLDPDSTRFVVPAQNIMSYASDGCVEEFSPEQITAMTTNLGGRLGLENPNPDAFAAARGEDVELLTPMNNATVEYSDSVTLRWNRVPNADFYLLQLNANQNFNGAVFTSFFTTDTSAVIRDILLPNGRYYWRVRPVNGYDVSGSFSDVRRFRNGAFSVATIDPILDAAVDILPNPVSGGRALRLRGTDTETGHLNYELIDAAGRRVVSRSIHTMGRFDERIETGGMDAGIYFLRMTLNGKLLTRRVVITP